MDLDRFPSSRSRSRMSINKDNSNNMPLYSRISIISNAYFDEDTKKDDSLFQLLSNPLYCESRMSNLSRMSQMNTYFTKQKSKKTISYGVASNSPIDLKQMLQILTQQVADQLAIIIGKTGIQLKGKLYAYNNPEERFNKKKEYTLEQDKPLKTDEEKMLKVQKLIKAKIDDVIMFLHSILKDTGEEMRNERTFSTLSNALENIYKTKTDDVTILNTKAEELCEQLFHDIKRIETEADRLLVGNRAIEFGFLSAKDRVFFLNMKKMNYMEKWETSRRWLHKYSCDKQCNNITNYIRDMEDKILKDEEANVQITLFLDLDIQELEEKRDVFPEKLDNECDVRNRVISQMKEELENMAIHKKELAAEIKLRTKKMEDWIIYRTKKEAEDAELQRIADEEELARQLEEERIAAELAAEEEFLATLTFNEREQYFKNKKKEAKKAAKAQKAAQKAAEKAEKKKRRTA